MAVPTLSLCLIVRDEEKFLPDCLASVEGLVDQIVVVDTGSTDSTAALARAAGALVIESPWQEDFSQARNVSLEAATGDFVLILDADERLGPGAAEALRAAVNAGSVDCGMLPLHNATRLDASLEEVTSGTARKGPPLLLPRLLRRTADLSYTGAVHESIAGWLAAAPRAVQQVSADIIHYGYVTEIREARSKGIRNLELLEKLCLESPDDSVARSYLARELLRAGHEDRALAEAKAGWSALARALEGDGLRPPYVSLASQLVHTHIRRGELKEADAVLKQALAWGTRHPNFALLQGWLEESLAEEENPEHRSHLENARRSYEACLQFHGIVLTEETMPGATSWAGQTRLGVVLLRLGRHDEASAAFQQALADKPGERSAALGLAEAQLERGRPIEALAMLEPLLGDAGPDGWSLAAMAASSVEGGEEDAAVLMAQAVRLAGNGFMAPHRLKKLQALQCLEALRQGRPISGPGWAGLIGAIVCRIPVADHAVLGQPLAAGLIEKLVARWLSMGRVDLLEPLLEPRADALIPGLKDQVMVALTALGVDVTEDGEPDFVFVGGTHRSGTTLLRDLLDAHPRVACGPELKLVQTICTLRDQWWSAMGNTLTAAGLDEQKLDAAVRAFVMTLLQGMVPDPTATRIAEQTPHNLLHMAMLGRLFPRARFVHIVRDARAVAASLVRQQWVDPATGERLWYCKDVASGARYWAQVIQTVRQQAAEVPGRYLELRYEDLVREPRATMETLMAFLGEAWDDSVMQHHTKVRVSSLESSSAAVPRPIDTSAVDRWRQELRPADLVAIEREVGTLLPEWSVQD